MSGYTKKDYELAGWIPLNDGSGRYYNPANGSVTSSPVLPCTQFRTRTKCGGQKIVTSYGNPIGKGSRGYQVTVYTPSPPPSPSPSPSTSPSSNYPCQHPFKRSHRGNSSSNRGYYGNRGYDERNRFDDGTYGSSSLAGLIPADQSHHRNQRQKGHVWGSTVWM